MLGRSIAIAAVVFACFEAVAVAFATTYTLPSDLHWVAIEPKGASGPFHYATIRGKYTDACDNIIRTKFPDGFVYPWHTNDNIYSIYTSSKERS